MWFVGSGAGAVSEVAVAVVVSAVPSVRTSSWLTFTNLCELRPGKLEVCNMADVSVPIVWAVSSGVGAFSEVAVVPTLGAVSSLTGERATPDCDETIFCFSDCVEVLGLASAWSVSIVPQQEILSLTA